MEEKKISVIIPVYNTVEYLAECLESVTAQTYRNLQIVLIDDHSQDGSSELCDQWAEKDNRIRVIHRSNDGVSAARNQGIAETDGDYVTFVDADDKTDPDMFRILAEELERSGSDMAMCGFRFWHGEKISAEMQKAEFIRADRERYVKEYLLQGNTRCWSILYRRKCVEYRGFRMGMSIGEDMLLLADMLPVLSQVSITDYPGYFYRLNEKGVMQRAFRPSYMDQITCWKLAKEVLCEIYPEVETKVDSILAVSAMLTVGKLAAIPGKERAQNAVYLETCRNTVREALQNPEARKQLDRSYRLKTMLFSAIPNLYLGLYHIWKKG